MLDLLGIARVNVFCLDEPDRSASRAANERTLAHTANSEGQLVPFARLGLDEGAPEEARRCLDRGARGIKLHLRAQRFAVGDAQLEAV